MTFRETLIANCRAKAKPLGRLLTSMEVVELASELHEACLPQAPQKPIKAQKTREVRLGHNIPPTPAEVTSYSAEFGYPLNGVKWCDNYAAKGWIVSGKNRMVDWRAAVRNWASNGWGQEGGIALKKIAPKAPDVRYTGEPQGDWRGVARTMLHISDLPATWIGWWDVPPDYRDTIAKAMA